MLVCTIGFGVSYCVPGTPTLSDDSDYDADREKSDDRPYDCWDFASACHVCPPQPNGLPIWDRVGMCYVWLGDIGIYV